jgi:hypothetical protein
MKTIILITMVILIILTGGLGYVFMIGMIGLDDLIEWFNSNEYGIYTYLLFIVCCLIYYSVYWVITN